MFEGETPLLHKTPKYGQRYLNDRLKQFMNNNL